jgi:hypothetical protein
MPKRPEARSTTSRSTTSRSTTPRGTTTRRRGAIPGTANEPAPEVANVDLVTDVDPIVDPDPITDNDPLLEAPLTEDVDDVVDPDLRYRMISEAAYRRYTERNYADGYDLDDWLQAESEIDGLLRNPRAR